MPFLTCHVDTTGDLRPNLDDLKGMLQKLAKCSTGIAEIKNV